MTNSKFALDWSEKLPLTRTMLRMSPNQQKHFRISAGLSVLVSLCSVPLPAKLNAAAATPEGYTRAEFLATNEIHVPFTAASEVQKWLEARKAVQEKTAAKLGAFHNFKFEDRSEESGITFKHNVVDDAGKSFKAAHYDHGTGLAVADVDGDGLLDIYFTTQLGSNQLWRNLGNGTFEDITQKAGVGLPDQISVSAAFADVDNNGDPDLF